MACAYHPDKEGVGVCTSCSKEICSECMTPVKGKNYCPDCAQKMKTQTAQVQTSPGETQARTGGTQTQTPASSTGLNSNTAGLLCYVLGWLTGLVFLLIEQKDKYVRFHAMQSLVFFGGITILQIALTFFSLVLPGIFGITFLIGLLISLAGLGLWVISIIFWILGMVKAYRGERYKFPIAGNIAENQLT